MADPRSLARHLRQCFETGDEVRSSAADAKLWFLALGELTGRGTLAEAGFAARHLLSAFPGSAYIRHAAMLLDRMPPEVEDPAFASFVDRPDEAVQVVRRAGARSLLLAFCGRHGSLGMPVNVAHRWFGGLGVHVAYLRDPSGGLYQDGLPALGGDRPATASALRRLADDLGADRIVCYGNSTGGYAALLYGLDLGAAAVLAFNAVVIAPVERAGRLGGAARTGTPRHDLGALYAGAARRPLAHLVYGASNADDVASAGAMAGTPGVTFEAVPDCDGHDAHAALIERGRFGPLLRARLARCDALDSEVDL